MKRAAPDEQAGHEIGTNGRERATVGTESVSWLIIYYYAQNVKSRCKLTQRNSGGSEENALANSVRRDALSKCADRRVRENGSLCSTVRRQVASPHEIAALDHRATQVGRARHLDLSATPDASRPAPCGRFAAGLKQPRCELCGWETLAPDGRLPLELDHVNGVRTDHRLENLRILCPNCHSLQPTHRGLNIGKQVRQNE